MTVFETALENIVAVDPVAQAAAREHQDRLTKPPGALGILEDVGVQLAAIARQSPPPVPEPVLVAVFAADHGVVAEEVTPWPAEVTAQMVLNFVAGGAAINVLARQIGATVTVVDVGVLTPFDPVDGLIRAKVRAGSGNIAREDAMSIEECRTCLDVGVTVANDAIDQGARLVVTGDMGIGNTTASAALIAAFTGADPTRVTGRGTGIDDAMLAHKIDVIAKALSRAGEVTPMATLARLGGLEIAALCGFMLGAAARHIPVVIDGVISAAAALAAAAIAPDVVGYLIAGHRSAEPGASVALAHLGLRPLLDLDLRLGEGTGAALAVPSVISAARLLREMATFDGAGVTNKDAD